jgi:hypothetical protein
VEQAAFKIEVHTAERLQLTATQTGIEGGGPKRPVLDRQALDQRGGLCGGHDPARSLRVASRKINPLGWVVDELFALYFSAVKRLERVEDIAHSRRLHRRQQPIGVLLNVGAANLGGTQGAEFRVAQV